MTAPFSFVRVTISPDGKLVTAWGWSPYEFQVRATATGDLVRSFSGKGLGFALFSPDGRSLAVGDHSGYECWEIARWKSLFSRRTQAGLGVREFAFSPDSRILAVAHSETMVQFLDSSTGQEIAAFEPPDPKNINWLAFSPDGAYFAATGGKWGTQLWDLTKIRAELAAMNLDWDLPSLPAEPDPTAEGRSQKPSDPRNSQLTELRPAATGTDGL
jgi:WD40 repeat protein